MNVQSWNGNCGRSFETWSRSYGMFCPGRDYHQLVKILTRTDRLQQGENPTVSPGECSIPIQLSCLTVALSLYRERSRAVNRAEVAMPFKTWRCIKCAYGAAPDAFSQTRARLQNFQLLHSEQISRLLHSATSNRQTPSPLAAHLSSETL